MTDFLQLLIGGLSLGALYALLALGISVVFRSSQVFNFAHGELATIGAFLLTTAVSSGLPWGVALAGSAAATGLLAAGIERAVVRPLIGRPVFVTIILTIFVGYLLRSATLVLWGPDMRGMPTPWDTMATVDVGDATFLVNALGALGASAAALILFFLLYRRSRLGLWMRVTSTDPEVALALGIPVGRVYTSIWFLSGAYAAVAGVFLSLFPNNLDASLGQVALKAFPAVIVGGLTSPTGAVVASVLLGIIEVMAQAYLEPRLGPFGYQIHQIVPFLIMIAFLIARPYGLFGTRDVERV